MSFTISKFQNKNDFLSSVTMTNRSAMISYNMNILIGITVIEVLLSLTPQVKISMVKK